MLGQDLNFDPHVWECPELLKLTFVVFQLKHLFIFFLYLSPRQTVYSDSNSAFVMLIVVQSLRFLKQDNFTLLSLNHYFYL